MINSMKRSLDVLGGLVGWHDCRNECFGVSAYLLPQKGFNVVPSTLHWPKLTSTAGNETSCFVFFF